MILRFAFDACITNIRRTMLSVFLTVFGILLIVLTVALPYNMKSSYQKADALLTAGVKNTAIIREKNVVEHYDDYITEISNLPEISVYGSSSTLTFPDLQALGNYQKSHVKQDEFLASGSGLTAFTLQKKTVDLTKLQIENGTPVEELDFDTDSDKPVYYFYLGSGFLKTSVQREYNTENARYVIAGFLKPTQKWFTNDFCSGAFMFESDYTVDCTYQAFFITDSLYTQSDKWLCAANGYTITQAIDKMLQISGKYGLEISYTPLQTSFDKNNSAMKNVVVLIMRIVIITCVACILLLACLQFIDIFQQMEDFGIMYSIGCSGTDIRKIIFLKNAIVLLISFVFALPVCIMILYYLFQYSSLGTYPIAKVLLLSLPIAAAILVPIVFSITSITAAIVEHKSPVELIGGQND